MDTLEKIAKINKSFGEKVNYKDSHHKVLVGKIASKVHPINFVVGLEFPGDTKQGLPTLLAHIDRIEFIEP